MPRLSIRPRCSLVPGVALAIASAAGATPPTPDHVVIVIEENHSFSQVIGSPSAPYINSLASGGASFTNFYAITHPSQPNYVQWFSGSNQGITDDTVPAAGTPFSAANLGAALLARGVSFAGYSEDLPSIGSTVGSSGAYVRKHNPWVNWQNSPQGSNQLPTTVNLRFADFPSDFTQLPRVVVVVPNLNNDMHDGTVAQGDAWLAAHLGAYANWVADHNSLLVITFDEDESASRNRIPTILYGPMVRPGTVDSTWTLHNLTRTLCDMHGADTPGYARGTRAIVGAFQPDPAVVTRRFQQGIGGYSGAHDTWIEPANPATPHGSDIINVVDGSPVSQGLIRFDSIFGSAADQVPQGATIISAKLLILTGSASSDASGNLMGLYRMGPTTTWSETSTWNSLVGGISLNDVEAASTTEFPLIPNVALAWAIFDVTDATGLWSADPSLNHGWVIDPTGTDGWRWRSSDYTTVGDRPILEITYLAPALCYPNCDGSTTSPILNVADFTCFLQAYANGDPYANCDASTTPPVLNVADFTCFLQQYATGCP